MFNAALRGTTATFAIVILILNLERTHMNLHHFITTSTVKLMHDSVVLSGVIHCTITVSIRKCTSVKMFLSNGDSILLRATSLFD